LETLENHQRNEKIANIMILSPTSQIGHYHKVTNIPMSPTSLTHHSNQIINRLSILFRLASSVQAQKKSTVKRNQSKSILEILKSSENQEPLQLLDSRTSNNNGLSIAELKSGTYLKFIFTQSELKIVFGKNIIKSR